MPMTPRPNHRRQPTAGPRKKNPIMKSTRRAGTSRPARTKWKRPQEDSEAEADKPKGVCPAKQLRRLPSSRHEFSENLEEGSNAEADEPEGVRPLEEPKELSPQPRPVQLPSTSPAQRRRTLRLQGADPIQTTPDSVQHVKTRKRPRERPREDEVSLPRPSPEPFLKRVQTSVNEPLKCKTISEARVGYWRETGAWPTEEQEATMDRFLKLVDHARAKKRSLSRKRSNASASETIPTQSTSSMSRDQKCAPYRHPLFQRQLKECGSFMDDHELGITPESEKLCQQLLKELQPAPQHTLFSDDELFKKTCKRIKGENETKVVRDISQLIVPSAEILADKGATHLAILRETTNACWTNSIPFINPPGSRSRSGPRPQPDFGLGFDRDAFNPEQLRKLQPFLGDLLADSSFFAATYQMYFPFLTSEVKCGDRELDVADRQNAYTQSVILRGLHLLFQLVDQENELHREINSFSISHNDEDVRIWGHYVVIDGKDVKFYRHLISKFIFAPSGEGDQRWKAYKFVRNVYDLWLPKHFERICSVIDMLPADLNSDVSEQDLASSRSGLSQQLEDYSFVDEGIIPNSRPSLRPITPDTTINAGSGNSKKTKTK
ncbi:hypothetical protein BU26DRAFT_522295 [Trematosphaeria pertusa]|uniref:DUF7924 domain-containing protein n=1 Tax=Trematosphaeria pertusa TaxID=390896 RepID=A0A6A6I3X6_9PLEO|nr:uncharacterized protein BU26DRAFT_522295 [Trematosphaeria pertusa]KAF2245194.1 hypothetical protein BU26DRAFT_522295 [Trematosphaeria pertusa]